MLTRWELDRELCAKGRDACMAENPKGEWIAKADIPAPIFAALDDPAKAAALVIRGNCTWTNAGWEYGDTWETSCGNAWTFTDGGPEENDAKFCPYCGENLIPIRAAQATKEETK